MIRQQIRQILPPPVYRSKLISGWQNTSDIVRAISNQHKTNLSEANKIKHLFCGSNERETARNIFDFLKNEISYRIEPAEKQTTKSLSRFVADGYGDCKHFALFTNTILQQCGYKPIYRFAGYRNNKDLQHVYSYLPKSDTVIDAVLPSFDTEKKPTIKKDITMSLYQLSGVDNEINGISFSKIQNNLKKAATKSSAVVKKVVKDIPKAAQKLAQGAKTISLSAPRTAFTGLVAMNVRGLATNLKKLTDKKGTMDGLKFWFDFGGDRNALQKVIDSGSKKKRIFGVAEENAAFDEIYKGYSGDGVYIGEVVTASAAIAAATPILIKVADVLKKAGVASADDLKKLSDTVKSGSETFKQLTGKSVTDVIFKKDAGVETTKASITTNDLQPVSYETAEKVVTAAVAQSTGVDQQTINEMKTPITEAAPSESPVPVTDVKPMPAESIFPNITKNKMFVYGGIAIAVLLLLRKK